MNPKISITVDAKNKAVATITGMATVGAKIDVEVHGLTASDIESYAATDKFVGKSLRFRIVDECGRDLVRFPLTERTSSETSDGDQWQVTTVDSADVFKTYDGTALSPVDFDTDRLRKAFCGVPFDGTMEFGIILDSIVDKAQYAVGKMKVSQWSAASDDDPTVLPNWHDIQSGLDAATASVTKSGTVATISITDTHGNTTTATVNDGAKGDTGDTGPTGAKIVSQVKTGEDANGNWIYTQTFDDGTTQTFISPKGPSGASTWSAITDKPDVGALASDASVNEIITKVNALRSALKGDTV